ncbi:hypothetical protein M153_2940002236 [Pseudoloma neurophilia]|uniref:Uncharacterized protein n=1 Tax=Pseudoloma neurophilia TaxID=146866 RepID=A0A0R0LYY5_9MICR|nr:hypothetical protein M153_2940002236 [Pseudoloma neurophilia]
MRKIYLCRQTIRCSVYRFIKSSVNFCYNCFQIMIFIYSEYFVDGAILRSVIPFDCGLFTEKNVLTILRSCSYF